MVLSLYAKQRIVYYYTQGYRTSTRIRRVLAKEDKIIVTRVTIWKFLRGYAKSGSFARKEGSGRPSKITAEVKEIVECQMKADDETTAIQLHKTLINHGYTFSLSTILRCRKDLGWTFRGLKAPLVNF